MTNEQIINYAPDDATHYHSVFNKYYRFKNYGGIAEAHLMGKWKDYPLYPSIQSLADIQTIQKQRELIKSLLHGVDTAVSTLHYMRHNKPAMDLCESDLRELSLVISQEAEEI